MASFDQIVFNEILYYMAKPSDLIAHYVPYLGAAGRLIVSMYELDRSRIIWPMLEEKYPCEDAVAVRHVGSGLRWTIKTFRVSSS